VCCLTRFVCVCAGVGAGAATINKPLLARTLEHRFGFTPADGGRGGVAVHVSAANRRRDCIVQRSADAPTVHVQCAFEAPPVDRLARAVDATLGGEGVVHGAQTSALCVEPSPEVLRRALLGKCV
jgi:hypothetical protein